MDHYIDITIRENPEVPTTVLLNAVFAKLHKALHDLGSTGIGVSFPNADKTLGGLLRLHGNSADLQTLQSFNWAKHTKQYFQNTAVLPVPNTAQYRVVSRLQPKLSEAKIRRLIKRGALKATDVDAVRKKQANELLTHPYLELTSNSNGHRHKRFIQVSEPLADPVTGRFDSFGLSKTATVPWF